jgi:hypothetical protein
VCVKTCSRVTRDENRWCPECQAEFEHYASMKCLPKSEALAEALAELNRQIDLVTALIREELANVPSPSPWPGAAAARLGR